MFDGEKEKQAWAEKHARRLQRRFQQWQKPLGIDGGSTADTWQRNCRIATASLCGNLSLSQFHDVLYRALPPGPRRERLWRKRYRLCFCTSVGCGAEGRNIEDVAGPVTDRNAYGCNGLYQPDGQVQDPRGC